MRFLDRDHQLPRFVLRPLSRVELLALLDVELVNPPGDDIGHEKITQHAGLLSEFEDDVDPAIEVFHDAIDHVPLAGQFRHHEREALQPFHLAVQGDE